MVRCQVSLSFYIGFCVSTCRLCVLQVRDASANGVILPGQTHSLWLQILSNARERQLYDLKLDKRTGRHLHRALDLEDEQPHERATGQASQAGQEGPGDHSWIREDSWASWAATAPAPRQSANPLDRYGDQLHVEFRQALRHHQAKGHPSFSEESKSLPQLSPIDPTSQRLPSEHQIP